MKRWLFGLGMACGAFSALAQVDIPGQQQGGPSLSTGSVPLTYTGADNRVSVGIDQDGHSQGELLGVFGNNGEHAYVAQLWWGYGGAGGVQADYNWLFGTTLEEAKHDPESITVAKLSFAIDQDSERNRQANVGFAYERKEFFLNFYLAGKISNPHESGVITTQSQSQMTGTDDVGNFTQTQTSVTTTQLQSQPYNYSFGVHGGHFSDPLTARFNGGLDYSKGKDGANEKRASVSVDKYIGVQGWSVSAMAEHAKTSGPLGNSGSDNRWWMFLRYEFGGGGAFKPTNASTADTAWIDRALHEPVTGHPRTFTTYKTTASSSTKTIPGQKQYTARFPLAHDDSASVAENSSANPIDVLANDSDPDGGTLTIAAVGPPAHGAATISGNQIVYTPTPAYSGSDRFTYTVTTAKGLSASANVNVTVMPIINPPSLTSPVARDDAATTTQNSPVTINVLANDSDPKNYPLTVTGATSPAHGVAHVNTDNSVTYTPIDGYSGPDNFAYTISNGHGGSASAHVTITIQAAPPPIARNDTASTPTGTPVTVDVLANDGSPAGYPLTVTSAGPAGHGSAQVNSGGTVTYTPAPLFSGYDSFPYSISDGHGGISTAIVTITVEAPVATLTAQNDAATTAYATPVNINVLANDQGPAGSSLTIKSVTTPAHGTAQIGANGIVVYTPAATFNGGTDTFNYTVSDGPDSAVATVTVTVQAPGAPVAQNDRASTAFATPIAIPVLLNDSDPSSFPLTVTQVTTPAHGTAVINPNNTVTYTPAAGYVGADSFGYTIGNGHGGTASATVSVTVGSAPPPVANNDQATTPFNKVVSINVLANDTDPSSLPLMVTLAGPAAHGTTHVNGDNTITYTPQATFSGSDQFTYAIDNGHGGTASATVTVTVLPPQAPIATNDSAQTPYSKPVTITVLANDSDPNGLPLAISSFTQPPSGFGTASLNSDNTITYTPGQFTPPGSTTPVPFVGTDTFTYTVADSSGAPAATATVTVTVLPPPPPVANDDTATALSGPIDIPVLQNDFDAKGLTMTVVGVSLPAQNLSGSSATINADGTIHYSRPDSSNPIDTFTYTIRDPYGQTASAKVTVNVP